MENECYVCLHTTVGRYMCNNLQLVCNTELAVRLGSLG